MTRTAIHGPIWLTKPTTVMLEELLKEQHALSVTYPTVGMVMQGATHGFVHHRSVAQVGTGTTTFDRAVNGLRSWQAHIGAGFDIYPQGAPIYEGATVILVRRFGPFYVTLCCRVLYLLEGEDRWGFGYGTLPGHLEQGEETFMVKRDPGGCVFFEVESLSRPGRLVVLLGYPVARFIQRSVTRQYLAALCR